jgi:NitT/TauT family transport system substrate-binding protein
VCYSAITATQAVTWYAYENHLFQKYGLDVRLIYINSGTKAVTTLLAGDADICQVAGSAVVNAVAAGQDAVMIAGLYNTYPASLMVTPDIKSAQDLKGKALAISQPGSSTDIGTRLALHQLGLAPDKDVALLAIGEESARMAAMDTGQVTGTILTSPDTLRGRQKGYVVLLDLAAMNIPYQHTGIATTHKYLQTHPREAENFLKATLEAIASMKKDPDGTKAVLAKYLLLDPVKDAEALDDSYQTVVLAALSYPPFPSLEGIQTVIDYQLTANPAVGSITPDQVADPTILKDLEASGFIAGLGK